jgi:hypothetical protein
MADVTTSTTTRSAIRNRVRLSSYSDEAIRSRVETWADIVTALQ